MCSIKEQNKVHILVSFKEMKEYVAITCLVYYLPLLYTSFIFFMIDMLKPN